MLQSAKRRYALKEYSVECRPIGWFFRKTYGDDPWHGPYSSDFSICLMIARQLRTELLRRDKICAIS